MVKLKSQAKNQESSIRRASFSYRLLDGSLPFPDFDEMRMNKNLQNRPPELEGNGIENPFLSLRIRYVKVIIQQGKPDISADAHLYD